MAFDLETRPASAPLHVRRPEGPADAAPPTAPPTAPPATPAQRVDDQVAQLHQVQPLQQAQQQQVTQHSGQLAAGSADQAASYWVRRRRAQAAGPTSS